VLALIDFGLVGRVSRQMQDTLISLVLALAPEGLATQWRAILYRLGTPDSAHQPARLQDQDIDEILNEYMPDLAQRHRHAKALCCATCSTWR
jgi:ubiquinone biosynthesis protein